MSYASAMTEDISVRALRNHAADVLRRVEAGERLRITVDRRPVAELSPLPQRRQWVTRRRVLDSVIQADSTLASELAEEEAAISVVTLAELELGLHMASGEHPRAIRLRTLGAVRATYAPLPIDEAVASAFAELAAASRQAGRRPKVQDAWTAATARTHGVPVFTHDDDFDGLPGVEVVHV